ncbi:MAG TPA: 2-C-methyl-D-erythritol 2,4-cyclodiphosphate synthase [Candidatus Latescibacteria bacterium]|nr:2-C-methyl-D-erythritol 2,4-cyclodiphosphate synthase [Candidatus Latescibacterota bacterium]
MYIGQGYDVHPLVSDRRLVLGGVEIPFEKGLFGHSDADVLCHAVADAILGALALGDIGVHFPDTDPRFKDISSLILLERVADLVRERSVVVVNVDSTVIAQEPRIGPFIPRMRQNLAEALGVERDHISVKVTSTEGLGFVGRGEGIAAQAVALVTTC